MSSAELAKRVLKVNPFIYLVSHKMDIGKQCRPRSDAEECDSWSWSALFVLMTGIVMKHGTNKNQTVTHYFEISWPKS